MGRGLSIYSIERLASVTSTHDEAFKRAQQGAPEGTVIIAQEQTKGKGRLGRRWFSEKGNLYLSLILRPQLKTRLAAQLTFAASLAVKETLATYLKQPLQLKWPNDVMAGGKKICGILNEIETEGEKINFVLIGVGVNLNQKIFPKEISNIATSVVNLSRKEINLQEFTDQFLNIFAKWYGRFLGEGFEVIRTAWNEQSQFQGRTVAVQDGKQRIEGISQGLHEDGALLIKSHGKLLKVYSGDLLSY